MRAVGLPRRVGAEQQWVIPAGTIVIGLVAVILWSLLAASPVGWVVASPLRAVQIMINGLVGPNPMILPHAVSSFSAAFIGFGLAIVVGVTWGIFLGISWYWRTVWEPIILSAYSIPKIILFPIFLFILGIGLWAQVSMAFIHAVFPIIVNVMTGVKEVNTTHVKVGHSFKANPWQMVTKIYFPSIALSLVVGLRMGFSFAILGVVLSELFASREGLGRLIMRRYAVLDINTMYAAILLLFLVAFAGNVLFWALEKKLRGTR
ncbi:MAG: ABC transporter permease subunit [Dehalococcoidia bacterium]|nr:ABC transporter permease subunit [Dehalococcoidia bacterium]